MDARIFQQVVGVLSILLQNKVIDLEELVKRLRPWLELKSLGIVRTNPHKTISWSRGKNMGVAGEEQVEYLQPDRQLSITEITGLLDHIGIMAASYSDLPESPESDRQILAVIANLAATFMEELSAKSEGKVLAGSEVAKIIEKPLAQIGLRLVKMR